MGPHAFHRWMLDQMPGSYLREDDPVVEMFDGVVRIHDQRGGELRLPTDLAPERYDRRSHPTRVLRALAQQLMLCADEIERRAYERVTESA